MGILGSICQFCTGVARGFRFSFAPRNLDLPALEGVQLEVVKELLTLNPKLPRGLLLFSAQLRRPTLAA